MVFSGYSIGGYFAIGYQWLLMVILSMAINDYYINAY
jgi:hypothetical protein